MWGKGWEIPFFMIETAESGRSPILMEGGSVTWRGLLTPEQLDDLERHCNGLPLEQAQLTGGGNGSIRSTRVAWVKRNAQTEDLYLRMEAVVLRLNADLFHFELSGLTTM